MQKLVRNLPWLVAGAALYHLGRVLLTQHEANLLLLAARRKAEAQAKNRRLYLLATTCRRGTLN
jgi:hypothetical protein